MLVLFYECYLVLSKIFMEQTFVKQAFLGVDIAEKDRAKVTKIVYGVLDKNIELDFYINSLCQKSPKNSVKIILKIALYNLKYLNKKPYAVTDASVGLLKKMGKGGASGFVNAILRKFANNQIPMPTKEDILLSVKYSYPLFAIRKLMQKYSMQQVEDIISYDKEQTCLRFNEGINVEEYLEQYEYEKTPFDNVCFVKNFKMEDGFFKGDYTFQSIGSVAICEIAKGEGKLLDACAAPGGKSVNLARSYTSVTSLDLHEHRVELINTYARRMRVKIDAFTWDSTKLKEEFINSYDAVLCDVPCSGLGVLKDNPDIKLNRKEEDIISLKETQLQILKTCSNYVKVGGRLIYSTCSILPEENEQNVLKFLKQNDIFVVEEITSKLNGQKEVCGITFLPHISLGAGFYCCSLRRVK